MSIDEMILYKANDIYTSLPAPRQTPIVFIYAALASSTGRLVRSFFAGAVLWLPALPLHRYGYLIAPDYLN